MLGFFLIWFNYICSLGSFYCSTFNHIFPFFLLSFLCLPFLSHFPLVSSIVFLSLSSPVPSSKPEGVGGCGSLRSISWWGCSWVQPEPFFPPYNAVFSLTLIKVHLASKCCGPFNTDCTKKRKWKKDKANGGDTERDEERGWETDRQRETGHHVDKGRRKIGLMVTEDGQNNHNHCSPLTRLNIGLM